ncbi:Formylglycine-generating sulfatase enzyme [compost metagenome]
MVTKYKGFYVGRYEAAFDYNGGNIRAASKKSVNKLGSDWSTSRNASRDGYLWNFVTFGEGMAYSESMASKYGYDTTKVATNIVTGKQWDTTMKWFQASGITVTDYARNSWGNFANAYSPANVSGYGSIQISGFSNYWKAKNIYDMSGNLWEWTIEYYSSQYILRGGSYASGDTTSTATHRYASSAAVKINAGFRVALYVK